MKLSLKHVRVVPQTQDDESTLERDLYRLPHSFCFRFALEALVGACSRASYLHVAACWEFGQSKLSALPKLVGVEAVTSELRAIAFSSASLSF